MLHWYHTSTDLMSASSPTHHTPLALCHLQRSYGPPRYQHYSRLSRTVLDGCHLVPVHSHPLAVPAELTIRGRRDGSRAVTASCGALLERKQLLSAEGFVVDLGRRLDQVL
jgi:hypothetical protein